MHLAQNGALGAAPRVAEAPQTLDREAPLLFPERALRRQQTCAHADDANQRVQETSQRVHESSQIAGNRQVQNV